MYFGPNEENDCLIEQANKIKQIISDMRNSYEKLAFEDNVEKAKSENKGRLEQADEAVADFSKECRKYYKREWEKVKKGE